MLSNYFLWSCLSLASCKTSSGRKTTIKTRPLPRLLLGFTQTMKQPVLSNGHGGRISSPSVAARTRVPRAAAAPIKEASSSPAPAPATPPRARRLVRVSSKEERVVTPAAAKPKRHKDDSEEETRKLRGEVEALRKEVDRLQLLNTELECDKSDLTHQLALARCTITRLQEQHDIHKAQTVAAQRSNQKDDAMSRPQPPKPPSPPPPPPPSSKILGRAPAPPPPPPQHGKISTVNKATALVEMYNSLNKRDTKKAVAVSAAHHNSIVGELQNRSTHLLAIKTDVETKGELINGLINKVHTNTYTDVEQVLTFVDWLDQQLSTLSDETGVLKHFSWPEKKADALREAAFEYRDLKCVVTEVSSLSIDDGSPTSCEATLRKISSFLDKLEKSMKRLLSLRSSAMPCYKQFGIPTEWMLDSGIASKIKVASVALAKVHMKRVLKEIVADTGGGNTAALVAQSVRFTYRVHQFAGGLDSEAMHAFEELTQRSRLTTA
ncbi:INCREASED PETAL GROWTH ANISOTROPY 1-like protein 2 isoform X1 [Lolium perenne]|uniref:INCREASED PETAL GROWTH ANISOTROPY 1-like protein 2 isoform X1 n=2 Tax=Lolium perenne TaxID=4522 RepID=UPI0021F5CDE6|nr:protein CHUP1, chloroplastic-like isoform X1 [Lolium perenne]